MNDQTTNPLTAAAFDAIVAPRDHVWGIGAIARELGVSVDKARRLAQRDEVPITQPAGQSSHHAFRSELRRWLRGRGVA